MKYTLLLFIILLAFGRTPAVAQVTSPTPPMGWNSYNCFGSAVHENEVKANAAYMAKYMKQYGWQYLVVDFLWAYDNPPGSNIGNPFQKRLQDGSYIPWLSMDKWGRLLPNANKFPSAFPNGGFTQLSKYVHGLGLKFGIHIMRGIPRQVVWAKAPVLGTNGITADMIADTASTCTWMNHMYGLDMSKPGAQQYLNSILNLYASWGVDLIKVDDIARPYRKAEIEGYKKAIDQTHRKIVLSISPGETPLNEAAHVNQYADMWRMADDFWDNWKEILHMFNYAKSWEGKAAPGHWPDCDMLQIGKLSKRGPVGPERYSRFTNDELYTHMTFWCIYRSPLMMGGNMPENRPLDLQLLTNPEVLQVNQHGLNPRQLYLTENDSMAWYSGAERSKDIFVALFNLSGQPQQVNVDLRTLHLTGKAKVRDLWKRKDAGTFLNSYGQMINPHGAALIKLSPL